VKLVVISVTVIGAYVAPVGTITLSEVVEAVVTTAFTAPKYTTLFAAVVLKFVPVIVTVVPMGPEVGEKEVIDGTCANAMLVERRNKKTCRANLPKVNANLKRPSEGFLSKPNKLSDRPACVPSAGRFERSESCLVTLTTLFEQFFSIIFIRVFHPTF
jgi:hypothetical protein